METQIKWMLQESSFLARTQELIKNYVFGFLYILQKDSQINPYFLGVLNFIQYLQLHGYMFREEIRKVWENPAIAEGLDQFLSRLLFLPYFTSRISYVAFLFIQMGLLLILLIVILHLGKQYYVHSFINRTIANILRVILLILITVLFMPILNFNANVWKCSSDGTTSKFYDLECFASEHIAYCFSAVLNLILYISIALVLTLTVFECRFRADNVTAKMNARADAIMQLYITVQEIAFSIMHSESFLYILLVITLGGCLIIFLAFAFNSQYHDFHFSRYHAVLSSVLIWSAFMLGVAATMEGSLIGGSIVAWLVGIPFVVGIIVTQRDRQLEMLIQNVNKLNSADEIMSQIRYILTLLRLQNKTKYAVILDGYIEVHRSTCDKPECPLKKFKPGQNKRIIAALKQNNPEVKNDKQALLVLTLYQILERGLEKFERNVDLRITYAFFLLEIMSYKRKALQELQKAEGFEPSFDTQFVIFKYKRVVESEIQEESKEKVVSNHEILPISAAPPIIASLAQQIEKSAYLHLEYWSELNEEAPDLNKLERNGKKVTESIRQVQFLWNKLKRVSPNNTQSTMLYSAYLIEVLNDKEYGQNLNEALRKMMSGDAYSKVDDIDSHDFSNDPIPTIVLSSENEQFGVIQQINGAAASLFNYTKSELMSQNVSMLMPEIIGKQHDRFIEEFLNNSDYKYQSKDRSIICKGKHGYLFSMNVVIRPINSVKSGVAFVGAFVPDKFTKSNAFILVNQKGVIEGVSTGCVLLLKIDARALKSKRYLNDYFPKMFDNKDQYMARVGLQVNYNVPKDLQRNWELLRQRESRNKLGNEGAFCEQFEYSAVLTCQATEIQFSYSTSTFGYIFRFERVSDLNQSAHNSSVVLKKGQLRVKEPKRLFYLECKLFQNENNIKIVYDGQYRDVGAYSDVGSRIDDSVLNLSRIHNNDSTSQKKHTDSEPKLFSDSTPKQVEPAFQGPRYDEGIRRMRLYQNKIQEIIEEDDEKKMEEEEQEYEGNQYMGINQNLLYDDSDENQQQDQDAFSSRSKLESFIDQSVLPFPIKFLRIAEAFVTLSMIALAFVDYFMDINQLGDIQSSIDVYNAQTDIMAEWQYFIDDIRNLHILHSGIEVYSNDEIVEKQEIIREKMKSTIATIQARTNYITFSNYARPQDIEDLYNQPSIKMKFDQSLETLQDFQEASAQMLSYAILISNSDLSAVTLENMDVSAFFILHNGFNAYLESLLTWGRITLNDFRTQTADRSDNFVIIVVVVGVVLAFSFAMIVLILLSIRLSKEQVIIMFLELPPKLIKALFNKCEQFVKQINQLDSDNSEADAFDQATDGEELVEIKKKKKKFKNTTPPPFIFYAQIFLLACFMQIYFILSLLLQKENLSETRQIIYEANATIYAESFYAYSCNVQQLQFIDAEAPTLGTTVNKRALMNIQLMYEMDSMTLKDHSANMELHEESYLEAFNTILFSNPCEFLASLNNNLSIEECETFAEGSIKSGCTVALTRFFENIRYLQSLHYQIVSDQNFDPSQLNLTINNVYPDKQKNLLLHVLKSPMITEIKQMQRSYFRYAIRELGNKFIEGLDQKLSKYSNQKVALFITYLAILVAIYILYWVPFHQHLMQDIWKTRMTLLMIPVENLRRLKVAKYYLKQLIINKHD